MANRIVPPEEPRLLTTGVAGLDEVLRGGLAADRVYLVEGSPGSGKTTLALQFLLAGVSRGEPCMLVSLSETAPELHASAASHGWSLEPIPILEIAAAEERMHPEARYTMYHSSEVELGETIKKVLAAADRLQPVRLVFDSLSELRLLAENTLRYRRQILALKQHFANRGCAVLLIDDRGSDSHDMRLHSLVHGVITLQRETTDFGPMRRRLQVTKMRGRTFSEGYHDFAIRRGGLQVFPRLVAAQHRAAPPAETVSSGLPALDALLGGGLARGTSTLMLGPAGTGKSTLAAQYALAAAKRGEHASLFVFDESLNTLLQRMAGLGMDLQPMVDAGRITLRQVDPAELSPGEFAAAVRQAVDPKGSSIVAIDSLNGYLNAMPSERFLMLHLHELLSYLGQRGVMTLMLMAQHGVIGTSTLTPVDASYLADNVILLRYFEARGEVRQAISVIKKRTGNHERTVRELRINRGIEVGEPLREFEGVLSGAAQLVGPAASLRNDGDARHTYR
ncbi:MAG TPA: ATPase domain-containing protein [Burkholderiaceae bacterium]|nr:ATPase domain-containing protein [Burkholderiaceae bacterium]